MSRNAFSSFVGGGGQHYFASVIALHDQLAGGATRPDGMKRVPACFIQAEKGFLAKLDRQCSFTCAMCDEITRGFWKPPDERKLDDRGHDLDESNTAPRPVVVDVCRAPSNAGDDCILSVEFPKMKMITPTQSSQIPQAIVDSSDGTTMLGMANFRQEQWRRHLSQ